MFSIANLLVILIIALIIGLAIWVILRDKRRYRDNPRCAGCPYYAQGKCQQQQITQQHEHRYGRKVKNTR